MKTSNLEKMILCVIEAKFGTDVKATLIRRAHDWKNLYHVKLEGSINTLVMVSAEFGDDNYGVTVLHPLYSGKNERLVNLEFTDDRWISIGNCRYSPFNVIVQDECVHLSNKEFSLVVSKLTGNITSYENSNASIDYKELFLNPATKITASVN